MYLQCYVFRLVTFSLVFFSLCVFLVGNYHFLIFFSSIVYVWVRARDFDLLFFRSNKFSARYLLCFTNYSLPPLLNDVCRYARNLILSAKFDDDIPMLAYETREQCSVFEFLFTVNILFGIGVCLTSVATEMKTCASF